MKFEKKNTRQVKRACKIVNKKNTVKKNINIVGGPYHAL